LGQKVHPTGFRIGVNKPWLSNWFASKKDYANLLAEDFEIRKYVKKKLYTAGVSRIEIQRKAQNVHVTIVTAKPGIVVGRGGSGIEALRKDLRELVKKRVQIDVLEVARIDGDSQLVSEAIALQLEKRIAFRRAMKQAVQRSMRAGVQGIKIAVSGRLGGAEIARTEWTKEGRIPLHTLRADIDYGFSEANTVWIFKGEIMPGEKADSNVKPKSSEPQSQQGKRGRARGRD
jgi:small subunit ribosomal protein S3